MILRNIFLSIQEDKCNCHFQRRKCREHIHRRTHECKWGFPGYRYQADNFHYIRTSAALCTIHYHSRHYNVLYKLSNFPKTINRNHPASNVCNITIKRERSALYRGLCALGKVLTIHVSQIELFSLQYPFSHSQIIIHFECSSVKLLFS